MSDLISRADAIAAIESDGEFVRLIGLANRLRALPSVEVGVKPRGASGELGRITVPAAQCGAPYIGQYEYVAESAITPHLTATPAQDVAGLVEVLRYYETQFCEGFCEDMPDRSVTNDGMENDCGGCKARAALARMKEAGE